MPNSDSIPLKIKELLMYHRGCHGNLVPATKKEASWQNMNSIQGNKKEIVRLHPGFHGNIVGVATK